MKRKLILMSLGIGFCALTLTTSTFAYINNKNADVSNIELSVSSDRYTEISVDGINFKDNLSLDDIKKAIVAKYKGYEFNSQGGLILNDHLIPDEAVSSEFDEIKFKPVTTIDSVDFYKLDFEGDKTKTSLDSGSFVSFDLYFKSITDKDISLYFNTSELNLDSNFQTTKFSSEEVDIKDTNLINLFNYYDYSSGDKIRYQEGASLKLKAANAIRFSTLSENTTKIYEPNLGLGSYATNLLSDNYDGIKAFSSRYDGKKNAAYTYVFGEKEDELLSFVDIASVYQGFEQIDALKLIELKPQDVKKVNFKIWLEGFDGDCFQPIVGQKLNISLSFRASDLVNSYRINYHLDDEIKSVDYLRSNKLTQITPYIPYKYGKIFSGWYSDSSLTTKYDFTKRELNPSVDLYGHFE